MHILNPIPTIAIFDSSDDYLDIMSHYLTPKGYAVATLHMTKVKSGEVDISDYIRQRDPHIIIFDITFPYEENWNLYKRIRKMAASRKREFILTTPNIDALHDRIGKKVGAFQLVDKDMDLKKIAICVDETWRKMQKAPLLTLLALNFHI